MANYIFPAIFEAGYEHEQGYTVTFPDLPGCITEGDTLEESIYMAKDALAGYLSIMEENGEEIPAVSNAQGTELPQGAFIIDIEVNTDNFFRINT